MKSLLEQCNSWRPFLEGLESSLLTKNFCVKKVREIFRFVDFSFDQESLSWKDRLVYFIFWHTSLHGRISRYVQPVSRFMKKNKRLFQGAPEIVILTFNRFLEELFGKEVSTGFFIPTVWARVQKTKYERQLECGRQAMASLVEAYKLPKSSMQKEAPSEEMEFVSTLSSKEPVQFQEIPEFLQKKPLVFEETDDSLPPAVYQIERTLVQNTYCLKVLFQLWPFLSDELVWNDMKQKVASMRLSLTPLLRDLLEQKRPFENLLFECFQMDDVRAVMGEIIHRSFRQRDCVDAARKLLERACSLYVFAVHIHEQVALDCIQELLMTISSCMSPHKTWASLETREDVALVFRNTWITIDQLAERLLAVEQRLVAFCTKEHFSSYVKRLQLFISDIDASSLFDTKELFSSFQATVFESISSMFVWQRKVFDERLGCGILLMLLPQEERKKGLDVRVEFLQRRQALASLKLDYTSSAHGESAFVDFVYWSLSAVFECGFVSCILHNCSFEGQLKPFYLRLFAVDETVFRLWRASLPAACIESNETVDVVSLSEQYVEALCPTSEKGMLFSLMVSLCSAMQQLSCQSDVRAHRVLGQLAPLVVHMWRDLFLHGFVVSEKTFDLLTDLMEEAQRKELVKAKEFLLLWKQQKTSLTNRSSTLVLMGDVESLFCDFGITPPHIF